MRNKSSVQALCPEYQKLLKEEQVALSNWTRGRAEIHESISLFAKEETRTTNFAHYKRVSPMPGHCCNFTSMTAKCVK